ncbi:MULTISPECIES: HNH endonuclease signature motif containing protein [unclassified Phaeobacter]|uniref:HNH endonuclease signature motif containing protein n=1 Tax=unclassified Phaeobacter TaxID=2621772 RepID=UPI003A83830B
MPQLKICVASGCEDYALPGLSHCDQHEAERQGKLKARRAKAQTSEAALMARALYADPRWRAASKAFLRQFPLCRDCGELGVIEPATDVDHIEPHKGDRKLFWDRKNWQSLCHRCHSRKTAREVFHGGGVSGN